MCAKTRSNLPKGKGFVFHAYFSRGKRLGLEDDTDNLGVDRIP